MTKRAVIITTSVLVGLVAIFTILFGVVFRVREVKIVCGDDFCYKTQVNDILTTSKLKKNSSIFAVKRDEIASNIEKAYPSCDVELQYGGQPIYYYVMSVE